MPGHFRMALAAGLISAVAGVGVLAACGSPIIAGQTWQAVGASYATFGGFQPVPGGSIEYSLLRLQGVFVDGHNKAVPRTSFVESCKRYVSAGGGTQAPGSPPPKLPPTACLVLVNTGSKLYAASGYSALSTDGFSGTFTSLSKASATGTLTVQVSRLGLFYGVRLSTH